MIGHAPLLFPALCVSLCAFVCLHVRLCLCPFVAQTQMEKGREVTCFYSSSPGRYSAVVSPVGKWTSIILLTPHLSNTPSFLQAWRVHPPPPILGPMGISCPLSVELQVLGLAGVESAGSLEGDRLQPAPLAGFPNACFAHRESGGLAWARKRVW